MTPDSPAPVQAFSLRVLGRTIEHLGSQMYKHRNPSIAELVANAWDAAASLVKLRIPEGDIDRDVDEIVITDDGVGMAPDDVQEKYLVIGRNRRSEEGHTYKGRRVMGRKGLGKLAGFGLCESITVTTWTADSQPVRFTMLLSNLKLAAGSVQKVNFPWEHCEKPSNTQSGTEIRLGFLRHSSSIDVDALRVTLGRRFSRIVRGQMDIIVNGTPLEDPDLAASFSFPSDGELEEVKLPSGKTVQYRYSFSESPIRAKEMQGFVVYANGRAAQAPPFFFGVETTASGQHSTRYVTGEILADFVDEGIDDESDNVSTDRQELDWERDDLKELKQWGQEMTRKVLRDCAAFKGNELADWILENGAFKSRLSLLDSGAEQEVIKFLKILGQRAPKDDARTNDLADSLIRAYEFRNFHDVIGDINQIGDDPEKLEDLLFRLHDWKVLESRAILEIVKGRLSIIDKLRTMIVGDSPETASKKIKDNLHDLLAEYPWLFDPQWQVYAEEKSIGKELRERAVKDFQEDMAAKRVDFLAFHKDSDVLVIIEIKRPGHSVEFHEIQRLEAYREELGRAFKNIIAVLVYGGSLNIRDQKEAELRNSNYFRLMEWAELFDKAGRFYNHYRAVLEGDVDDPSFHRKKIEVLRTREILETGSSHRGDARKSGVGESDA